MKSYSLGSRKMHSPSSAVFANRKPRMQKVDAIIDLMLNDPDIARDQKVLETLRDAVHDVTLRASARIPRQILPKLYRRYRGTPFPLKQRSGRPVPPWRQLSPWMKIQIASLCIFEQGGCTFRAHLHEDVEPMARASRSTSLREYFRDRISRCARDEFGVAPFFWFVIEDRSQSGLSVTRPHVHGEVQILPHPGLPTLRNGLLTMKYRRIVAKDGIDAANLEHGRVITREVLLKATGNSKGANSVVGDRDQRRNLWMRKPLFNFGNPAWVSYAFKNARHESVSLGESRLVMSRELNKEAQRLWNLIRNGETAMTQWI